MRIGLVLAAAGAGTRFGGERAKQWLTLADRPVWHHALLPFRNLVDDIVVVVQDHMIRHCADHLPFAGPRVIAGGASRGHSVLLGLESLHGCDAALIHDAARPLIDPSTIEACILALAEAEGCVVASPCVDTLKRVDGDHIVGTLDREQHALAQTPQGMRLDPGLDLYRNAIQRGVQPSDDVQILEQAGRTVLRVLGTRANFKLTHPDDLLLASALLQTRPS